MTEQEFLKLIKSKSAKIVLQELAKIPAKERRAFAKPAMKLFKKLDRFWILAESLPDRDVKDGEAVTVAVLATASASELTKMSFFPRPGKVSLEDIIHAIEPDWLQRVVDHFVEDRVFYVNEFRPLWENGLCKRPTTDGIILNYYSRWGARTEFDEEQLLTSDVWRFFEVEGGGEDSLANHDKYLKPSEQSWAERLKGYADAGKLDRQRLLDASLDALDRDFAQYRAGWYSRFHVLMAPNADEVEARSQRYLRLLGSSIPPTVSFAMKYVQSLEKAGALDAPDVIAALDAPLQARAKGTVIASLKLLLNAAKRNPKLKAEASTKAVLALISEDAGVQGKALDAIEALDLEAVRADLGDYIDVVAPSLRTRIAELAGIEGAVEAAEMPQGPVVAVPIYPVSSADEALRLYLSVLENPRDPFDVERAVDGLSRFGAALQAADTVLSPLRKRAQQVCRSPGETDVRYVLALTGRALAEGVSLPKVLKEEGDGSKHFAHVPPLSLQAAHLSRNVALIERIAAGHSLPMLSLPSDTGGTVSTADLRQRLDGYRTAQVDVCPDDLALALMRLSPDNRNDNTEFAAAESDRAIAYAMGRDVEVGPTPELWAAAWRARLPEKPDSRIQELFKAPTPDCGIPAEYSITAERTTSGPYHWATVKVSASPPNKIKSRALPALFGLETRNHYDEMCCGHTFADIAWASLTRPADPEPFFRIGIVQQYTDQKLADNPTRAYLEPFFRPGPAVGPLGASLLAYFQACEDKSVTSLAAEAAATLAAESRLTAVRFATALRPFLLLGALPTTRWTNALKAIADLGAGAFAREAILEVLDFRPEDTPRDMGAMLELCFELHVAHGAVLTNRNALACLKAMPGGGKVARFRKKLMGLAESATS